MSGLAARSPSPRASGWLPVQNVTPPSEATSTNRCRHAKLRTVHGATTESAVTTSDDGEGVATTPRHPQPAREREEEQHCRADEDRDAGSDTAGGRPRPGRGTLVRARRAIERDVEHQHAPRAPGCCKRLTQDVRGGSRRAGDSTAAIAAAAIPPARARPARMRNQPDEPAPRLRRRVACAILTRDRRTGRRPSAPAPIAARNSGYTGARPNCCAVPVVVAGVVDKAAAGGDALRERQVLALVVRERLVHPVDEPEGEPQRAGRPTPPRSAIRRRATAGSSGMPRLSTPFEAQRGDLFGDEADEEDDDREHDQQDRRVRDVLLRRDRPDARSRRRSRTTRG